MTYPQNEPTYHGLGAFPQQQPGRPNFPIGPFPPQPPKRKSGLVGTLIVVAVVVVGGVIGLVIWLTSGDEGRDNGPTTGGGKDESAVTTVANRYVAAIQKVDVAAIANITCTKPTSSQKSRTQEITSRQESSIEILGTPRINGDRASLQVHVKVSGSGTNVDQDATINFAKQSGNWCLEFDWAAASGQRG